MEYVAGYFESPKDFDAISTKVILDVVSNVEDMEKTFVPPGKKQPGLNRPE